jgi:hypothetical protein
VLDPSAIRLLVEEGYRSNAAILGPKLVDYDRPEVSSRLVCGRPARRAALGDRAG